MGNTCGTAGDQGPELDYREDADVDEIRERFIQAGQGHVFNAWDNMDDQEKATLLKQCQQFDVQMINQLYENLIVRPQANGPEGSSIESKLDEIYISHISLV